MLCSIGRIAGLYRAAFVLPSPILPVSLVRGDKVRLVIIATVVAAAVTVQRPIPSSGGGDPIKQVSQSIVIVTQPEAIQTERGLIDSNGTGFIDSASGYVVTAKHVIKNDVKPICIFAAQDYQGDCRPPRFVYRDPSRDIAILDPGDGPPTPSRGLVPLLSPPNAGDPVWVFGFDFVTDEGFWRAIFTPLTGTIGVPYQNLTQVVAVVQHGFSGGPITNSGGRVLGMVSFQFGEPPAAVFYMVRTIDIQDALRAAHASNK